ncbi:MAG: hypothetical protein L0H36_02085 [bacterium]|nr:hypothetical protein [bacterium]MDN5835404.1 hypothetical protein [bacterium]
MNSDIYDDTQLEKDLKNGFGVATSISQVLVRRVAVSRTAEATLFLTDKKQLFLYITGQSNLLLSDVTKIVSRMSLRLEQIMPPKNRPDYFDEVGREKFRQVFPGREHISSDDLRYYRTLAPYNPALIQIAEVKNGEILCFDPDASTGWRVATKFTYRRIRTS